MRIELHNHIWVAMKKDEEKFLRQKTRDVDVSSFPEKEKSALLRHMKKMMEEAQGIGLSANQIGLPLNVFVAKVPHRSGGFTFYAIFNPRLEKTGGEKRVYEEGCLSIPGVWGNIERADRVVVAGVDKNGKPLKIKAYGLLARVFQHEIDHLGGKLFIDRAKDIHHVPLSERLKAREEKFHG